MTDSTINALFSAYQGEISSEHKGHTVFIADENCEPQHIELAASYDCHLVTNRKDIDLACKDKAGENKNLTTHFSDFDLAEVTVSISCILYRISKERPVCHYIFNQAVQHLPEGGLLILSGKKNEGIKNFHQKLTKSLHFEGSLNKTKDIYTAILHFTPPSNMPSSTSEHQGTQQMLDDKDYTQVREITSNANLSFYSKPGVYGWNKVDKGSELLIEEFLNDYQHKDNLHLLDLGCGYGYLSLRAMQKKEALGLTRLHASDNNAAAIACCTQNLAPYSDDEKIEVSVSADDCGSNILKDTEIHAFDVILCNPPFHQGFEHAKALTEKFLGNTAKLLNHSGHAYFVVNAFIGLEGLAKHYFDNIKTLNNTGQFKVICLGAPKR